MSHECKCKECHPEAFPETSMRNPNYRDAKRHHPSLIPKWVEVDGGRIDHASEALSGQKGWVIYYPSEPGHDVHRCGNCGEHVCQDVVQGHVVFGPCDPGAKTLKEQVEDEEQQTAPATGGIVKGPILAQFGKDGHELVVPLDKFDRLKGPRL